VRNSLWEELKSTPNSSKISCWTFCYKEIAPSVLPLWNSSWLTGEYAAKWSQLTDFQEAKQKTPDLSEVNYQTTLWVKKNTRHQTLGHNFTNYYPIFKNVFTSRLCSKFATHSCLNIPPHFKHVATLPCEIWMQKNGIILKYYCN